MKLSSYFLVRHGGRFYILNMKSRFLALFAPLLLAHCLSYASDALVAPVKKLEWLAAQMEVLAVAVEADGILDIDELADIDDNWSDDLAQSRLDDNLQRYFQSIVEQSDSPFVNLILLGSQGETLASWPITERFWQGSEAHFVYVMADEQTFIDQLSLNESNNELSAAISVPVKNNEGELFGVLRARVQASLQSLTNLRNNMGL